MTAKQREEDIGYPAARWKKGGRPGHGDLVLGYYRNDRGRGIDLGVYDEGGGGRLVIQKPKAGREGLDVPWSYYSRWAPLFWPEPETL